MTERLRNTGPSGILFSILLAGVVGGAGILLDRQVASGAVGAVAASRLAREPSLSAPDVRRLATWVVSSNDHAGNPFLIIDQARARLFAFSGQGALVGSAAVVRGEPWADPPAPAGRFVADGWRSGQSGAMVWSNRGADLALRPGTAAAAPRQLLSGRAAPAAHAGTFQVAADFYRQHVRAFWHQASIAYVLPDTPARHTSGLYAASRIDASRSLS